MAWSASQLQDATANMSGDALDAKDVQLEIWQEAQFKAFTEKHEFTITARRYFEHLAVDSHLRAYWQPDRLRWFGGVRGIRGGWQWVVFHA